MDYFRAQNTGNGFAACVQVQVVWATEIRAENKWAGDQVSIVVVGLVEHGFINWDSIRFRLVVPHEEPCEIPGFSAGNPVIYNEAIN